MTHVRTSPVPAVVARTTTAMRLLACVVGIMAGLGTARAAPATPDRRGGPSGSLVVVESNQTLPLVRVVVAVRSGSASDPHKKDGLANLTGEVARRGAARQSREKIDARLDALGATLDVVTDADSLRFEGDVLSRNLEEYLKIVADVLLRPDFPPTEIARTRRDILADIDEQRNDDRTLCGRFYLRNLYADHPYGHPSDGDRASLERIRREDLEAYHRQQVVGPNVVFAAAGDVVTETFVAALQRVFVGLPSAPAPGPNPLAMREPQPPHGWRIQLVDKPDRQQVQVMFGQFGVRATDPDFVPLLVALTSFGGHGMKATLMDEIRTKRGLAYGAYMNLSERLARGAMTGWFFAATDKTVPTLKLALRLYVGLMDKGIDDGRLAFAKNFLAASQTSEMDDPAHRLDARVSAEIVGLPAQFVDDLPGRIRAVTAAEVKAALSRNLRARDLAITAVGTASALRPQLIDAKVQGSAIDVVPYDSY